MNYSTPQYAHSWLPIRYFKEYGDEENYFIQLEYVINKVNYAPVIHKPLDFDIVAANGKRIFDDVDAETLELLQSRNYVLLTSKEAPVSNFYDRFYVTEIYGYAPDRVYETYSDEVTNSPTLLLPDGLGLSDMPTVSEERYYYYANSLDIEPPAPPSEEENYDPDSDEPPQLTEEEIKERLDAFGDLFVEIPGEKKAFIVGGRCNGASELVEFQIDNEELARIIEKDAVFSLYGKGRTWGAEWWYYFRTNLLHIAAKQGNKFYIEDGWSYFYETGNGGGWSLGSCFPPKQSWYGESITLFFIGNVRYSRNIQVRATTKVKFYLDKPPFSDIKSPMRIEYSEVDVSSNTFACLSDISTPTASEWIDKANAGEMYVQNGSKQEFRDGLYSLSTTYVPYC